MKTNDASHGILLLQNSVLKKALKAIENWEFPPVKGKHGEPSSYRVEYGSNGERDFMRKKAQDALKSCDDLGEKLHGLI